MYDVESTKFNAGKPLLFKEEPCAECRAFSEDGRFCCVAGAAKLLVVQNEEGLLWTQVGSEIRVSQRRARLVQDGDGPEPRSWQRI